MTYLYQAIKAALTDWLASIWKRLRARNTGDK